jgi:hypothetical protein
MGREGELKLTKQLLTTQRNSTSNCAIRIVGGLSLFQREGSGSNPE